MRFALVDGQREEAQPNRSGRCPSCDSPMIAKCGEVLVHHWAHKRGRLCDPWWENETEWHRNWKDQFPADWQEIVHRAESGERHIADVKTDHGWALEFQHSYIKPSERQSRDAFYSKLIWVVNGARRKRDIVQFQDALNKGTRVGANSVAWRVMPENCRLLNEWAASSSHVFVDFGEERRLWWLLAKSSNGPIYVGQFGRREFIHMHQGSETQSVCDFETFIKDLGRLVSDYESHLARNRNRRRF